jgi:hypothetical protein
MGLHKIQSHNSQKKKSLEEKWNYNENNLLMIPTRLTIEGK